MQVLFRLYPCVVILYIDVIYRASFKIWKFQKNLDERELEISRSPSVIRVWTSIYHSSGSLFCHDRFLLAILITEHEHLLLAGNRLACIHVEPFSFHCATMSDNASISAAVKAGHACWMQSSREWEKQECDDASSRLHCALRSGCIFCGCGKEN